MQLPADTPLPRHKAPRNRICNSRLRVFLLRPGLWLENKNVSTRGGGSVLPAQGSVVSPLHRSVSEAPPVGCAQISAGLAVAPVTKAASSVLHKRSENSTRGSVTATPPREDRIECLSSRRLHAAHVQNWQLKGVGKGHFHIFSGESTNVFYHNQVGLKVIRETVPRE